MIDYPKAATRSKPLLSAPFTLPPILSATQNAAVMSKPFTTSSRSCVSRKFASSQQTLSHLPLHICCSSPQRTPGTPTSSRTLSRRELLGLTTAVATLPLLLPQQAEAGFKKELKKRKIPLDDYTVSEYDGLKFYDKEEGRGKEIKAGDTVLVHFDCRFRGIDAVSSRYARTLGGNRTIAEPLEFTAGEAVNLYAKKMNDTAGGLFAGGSGPKPPPAISTAVIGMKPGGRRIVYVDNPDLGYVKGNQEIPAGAAFELEVEMLSAVAGKSS